MHYEEYVEAVCQQAEDRDVGHVRSISDYMDLRRRTIGAKPSFDLLLLPLELPDHILDHPVITELMFLAIDMIILANVRVWFITMTSPEIVYTATLGCLFIQCRTIPRR